MPSSPAPASPARADSAALASSNQRTPMGHRVSSRSTWRQAGTSEAGTSEMVNDHLNTQCKDSTVVVDAALLLAKAKPRNVEAAATAKHVYTTLCDSNQLTKISGDMKTLVEGRCTSEKAAYPGMQQLFDLIAHAVYDEVVQLDPTDPVRQETRLLQSTSAFDYVPTGSNNRNRPDMTIVARAVPTDGFPSPIAREEWCNIALVIEGKWCTEQANKGSEPGEASLDKACGQLARYVLNLYTSQPNRRFAWALIAVDTFVYVCLFGRDRVYRTQAINLATLAGRRLFAQFVICWSLAGPVPFGLDPTITFNATTQEWVIACFDDASADGTSAQTVYYAKHSTLSIRPSLFGRRTMSFFASAQPNGDATVFIKDAWPVAKVDTVKDDPRNEIVLLRHIHEQFSTHDPGVPYPQIKMGGTVQQQSHGELEKDDATVAYGSVEAALPLRDPESPGQVHRVHRRMVMTPIADRLNTLDNFYELIIVLADAMTCHKRLYDDCGIFHRDISTSNIMVVRQNGRLQGMLIDYDNAIYLDAISTSERPERTGTLPFMSIGNLEGNDTPRTALDDWESLLYVICWLGTYGLGENERAESTQLPVPKPEIYRWLEVILPVSKCHQLAISIVYAHPVLESFTQRLVPLHAATTNSALCTQTPVTGAVPLMPIQQWLFSLPLQKPHYFNQSFLLKVNPQVNANAIQDALATLLTHHAML
ncbi:hypothetical protein H4R34_004983 [Dimargaris verticillata]|uniref:Fungal-type protein kinase domain-containing protein n=1 Tax=Dimargaris verticillata TaxID=2761393 RepID=A0A9W8AXV4_9FUNG|nr:hypothetical protein H4R34_004983 [Dimargaris verticillata]